MVLGQSALREPTREQVLSSPLLVDDLTERRQHCNGCIIQHLRAELSGQVAAAASRPANQVRAAGPIQEGWGRQENVMDGLRVAATNASVVRLETAFGAAAAKIEPADIRAHYAVQGPPAAVRVIDEMRRAPNRMWVLRLVWSALHAWQGGASAERAETAQENMRRALGSNLADCINDRGTLVCETGHRGQMVKALGGYFPLVEVLPLTPQELVNEVAAGLQQELDGKSPTAAQLDVFAEGCHVQALSLYGAGSPHLQALPALVSVACEALGA